MVDPMSAPRFTIEFTAEQIGASTLSDAARASIDAAVSKPLPLKTRNPNLIQFRPAPNATPREKFGLNSIAGQRQITYSASLIKDSGRHP